MLILAYYFNYVPNIVGNTLTIRFFQREVVITPKEGVHYVRGPFLHFYVSSTRIQTLSRVRALRGTDRHGVPETPLPRRPAGQCAAHGTDSRMP
jgi:hypothetical protein